MGTPNYGADYETQYDFLQIGTITSAQAALAVTARDNASVVALADIKKVIWSPDQGTAAAILRFRVDGTEDDAPVIEMYGAKGADYYTRIATLTLAQGTQDWSGGHFVDEITLSNEAWAHGIRANSVTDEVGRVVFNTGGFDRFLFIASTLTVTTIHIDIARLDKQIDHGLEIHSAILVLADNMTVSDVVSAISDMHTDLEAGLTNLYGLLGVNNDLTDLSRLELDSINDGVSNTIVKLTNLYGLLGVNNDLTDLSRLELDSINDGISNAVVGLTNLYGLLGQNNDLTDLSRLELDSINDGISNAVTQLTAIHGKVNITNNTLGGTIHNDLGSCITQLTGLYGLTDITNDAITANRLVVQSCLTQLTGLYGLLGQNNDLTDLSRLELDSINDGVSNAVTQLTGLYGLLGQNNDLTDLSRLELDSINDGISNAVVGLTNLYGLLGVNNDLTDLTRIAVGGVANAVTSGSDSIVTALSQHEAGIRSGVKSALFDQETGTRSGVKSVMTDNETGMRSGVKSVFTDNETGMRSGITSALSNAVSELIINDDLVEAGLRSGVKSVFTDNETGMRSGILSALDLHEAGIRSGVKSAVTSAIGALMDGENISDLVDAVDLVTVEVSTAVSNLKAAVEAHGDIGIISGPETVTVDSNTETLSEMGIALEAGIRRVTLIPEGSGIYWADGAAAFGTNPFPNAVTQIDCTKAQIITREFVCSDGVTKTMQVIQEG